MKLDLLYTEDFDLQIANGDFVYDNGSVQQSSVIINATKGELRNKITLGVGLVNYIGSAVSENELTSLISNELKQDNILLKDITYERDNTDNIKIELNAH
jgi:polysaccharide deacetylase 2 family uncharacterized protein YibQ